MKHQIQKILEEQKEIQDFLLTCLQSEIEDISQNLDQKILVIQNDYQKFKFLLYLIAKISNSQQKSDFYSKIEIILNLLKDRIQNQFSNSKIFNIFKCNKRIILFLLEEKIINIDQYIFTIMTTQEKYIEYNYPQYFQPELKNFIDNHPSKIYPKDKNQKTDQLSVMKYCECDLSEKLPPNFYEERKIGQNNDYICQLIRNDSVVDFISYTNKINLSYENQINHSIFETNQFLLKNKKTTFIEYAAFFGSIQIFQYLQNNGVKLTPSIWLYAIHGNNASIIRILEEYHVEPTDKTYKQCLKESIKLHQNDIALYIIENYIQSDSMNNQDICIDCLKYYNFAMIPKDANIDHSLFGYLCKYDYYEIVNILLKKGDFDVNMYYESIYNDKNFNNISKSIDSIKFYLKKFQQHLTFSHS